MLPVVPPNTEVVIQAVTMLSLQSNVAPLGEFLTTGGGVQAKSFFSLVPAQAGQYSATQSLTQYADPGTQPTCQTTAQHAILSASTTFVCTVTGYTISLP
jgi:ABC-type spermidine/putrescine transport system permease subunit I